MIGSQNSSNSNRLREIGMENNVPTYLIDDAGCIDTAWFDGVETVGITAGASAPEVLVQEMVERLREMAPVDIEHLDGVEERVHFKMPAELAQT